MHYYNSLWSSHINSKRNPEVKIFKSKNANGTYYINDSKYVVKGIPRRMICMSYFKDNVMYLVRFHSIGNSIKKYYPDAMKIFESVRIDSTQKPKLKIKEIHINSNGIKLTH